VLRALRGAGLAAGGVGERLVGLGGVLRPIGLRSRPRGTLGLQVLVLHRVGVLARRVQGMSAVVLHGDLIGMSGSKVSKVKLGVALR
jgi:hypothetical protein